MNVRPLDTVSYATRGSANGARYQSGGDKRGHTCAIAQILLIGEPSSCACPPLAGAARAGAFGVGMALFYAKLGPRVQLYSGSRRRVRHGEITWAQFNAGTAGGAAVRDKARVHSVTVLVLHTRDTSRR